jgi:hypothetical protein
VALPVREGYDLALADLAVGFAELAVPRGGMEDGEGGLLGDGLFSVGEGVDGDGLGDRRVNAGNRLFFLFGGGRFLLFLPVLP